MLLKEIKSNENQMATAQVAQALKTYKHDLQVAFKNGESKAGMARIRAKIEELEAMQNNKDHDYMKGPHQG